MRGFILNVQNYRQQVTSVAALLQSWAHITPSLVRGTLQPGCLIRSLNWATIFSCPNISGGNF